MDSVKESRHYRCGTNDHLWRRSPPEKGKATCRSTARYTARLNFRSTSGPGTALLDILMDMPSHRVRCAECQHRHMPASTGATAGEVRSLGWSAACGPVRADPNPVLPPQPSPDLPHHGSECMRVCWGRGARIVRGGRSRGGVEWSEGCDIR